MFELDDFLTQLQGDEMFDYEILKDTQGVETIVSIRDDLLECDLPF